MMTEHPTELEKLFAKVENRREFAKKWKVPGGASMIYQHIAGLKPISLKAGLIYSEAFGVPLEAVSPKLAKANRGLMETIVRYNARTNPAAQLSGSHTDARILELSAQMECLHEGEQQIVFHTISALVAALQRQAQTKG
jgi:hypothetical protein